jgi:hypothetical protein
VIFFGVSAWLSSQSLSNTFKASSWVSKAGWFIVAFMILALASFCLSIVKQSISRGYISNRLLKLVFGAICFLFAWFFILMANTHGIYYIMAVPELRQGELRTVKSQMDLLEKNSENAFDTAKANFRNDVEADIKNMKDEIINPNNPGRGVETNKIVHRIEEKLGQTIDMPSNAPSDQSGREKYANDLANKIHGLIDGRLSVVDARIKSLHTYLQRKNYQDTVTILDDLIANFETHNDKEIALGLRNGYSTYAEAQDYVQPLFDEPLINKYTQFRVKALPRVPASITSERIDFVWGEYLRGGEINRGQFRWAILFGLLFDLACYAFWYFGVLSEED